MSREIDQRVVEMRFNNENFERNANTTIKTIDKLKEKLNFRGMSKGIEEYSNSATISLDTVTKSTDKVQASFSALQVVAMTTLSRITNASIDTGKKLIKSLSVDQITSGFSKYNEETASVQTLINATGKSIEQVEEYLSQLRWFSDETSYGFTEMTQALGMMTSTGGDIEKLIPMIEGVANATAYAGKGTAEFSRAIYNLSQSYGTGALQLIDWKSLEQAGVGSKQLKQTLIDVAVELGKIKKGEVTVANFSNTLQKKWADTSVMEAGFSRFAEMTQKAYEMVQNGMVETASEAYEILGKEYKDFRMAAARSAQEAKSFSEAIDATKDAVSSKWAETFKIIVGNYEEAKVLWTDVANELYEVFAASSDARNEMLQEWKDLGGRQILIEALAEAYRNLKDAIVPLKKAYSEMFPPMTSKRLLELTNQLKDFAKQLKLSEESAYTLKVAIKAVLLPIRLFFEVTKVGVSVLSKLVVILFKMGDAFLSLFSKASPLEGLFKKIFGDTRYIKIAESTNRITTRLSSTISKLGSKLKGLTPQLIRTGKSFDLFKNIADYFRPLTDKLLDKIVDGFEKLSKINFSSLKNFGKNVLSDIQNRLESISNFFSPFIEGIRNVFEEFENRTISERITLLKDAFVSFKNEVLAFIKGENVGEKFEGVSEKADKLKTALKAVGEEVVNFVSKLSPAKILVFSFGVALTGLLFTLNNTLKSFSGLASATTTVIKSFMVAAKPSKIADIARALTLLSGALVLMSVAVEDPEKLKQATVSLIELMAALTVMTAIIGILDKKLINAESFVKTTAALQTMAISILALAAALSLLSKVDMDFSLIGKVAAIGVMLFSLAGAMKIMGKMDVDLSKNTLFVLAFAISIGAIVKALEKLNGVDFKSIIGGLGSIGIMMGVLAGLSAVSKNIKFGNASGIMVMCFDLLLLAGTLKILAKVDMNSLIDGLSAFIPLMGVLTAIALVSKIAGDKMLQAGGGIALMSGAILLLAQAVKSIGVLDTEQIAKGTLAVSAMLGMFALIVNSMKSYGKYGTQTGKAILAMSAAVLLLSVSIKYIGKFSLKEVVQGTAVVSVLFGLFALVIKVGGVAKKSTAPILSMTLAVGLLSASLALISLLPSDEVLKASAALSAALIAFGVCMKLVKSITVDIKVKNLAIMGVMAVAFGVLFRSLSKIETAGIIEKASAISMILLALVAAIAVMSKIKIGPDILPTMGILAATMVAMGLMMLALSKIDTGEDILLKAKSLSLILMALTSSVAVLSIVGGASGAAMAGLVALDAAIANMAVVLIAAGYMMSNPDVKRFVENGVEFFGLMGDSIGAFVGGIIEGIAQGVGNSLPAIATGLSDFMTNIQPFIQQASGIDMSVVSGVAALSAALLILTGTGLLNSLMVLAGGWIGLAFAGKELVNFIDPFKQFAKSLEDIPADTVEKTSTMAKAVAALEASMPRSFGAIDLLIGVKSPALFGKSLVSFGNSMKKYSDVITENGGIDSEAVKSSATAAETLSALEKGLPGQLGVLQGLLGSKSLALFGGELKVFGEAIKAYSNAITINGGIDEEAIESSAAAAETLSVLEKGLPGQLGVLQGLLGSKSLALFGGELKVFGKAIKAYSDAITAEGGINSKAIESSKTAADLLVTLESSLEKTGGLSGLLSGEKDLGDFGKNLTALGTGLSSYYDSIKDVDFATIMASSTAIKSLSESCTNIGTEMATAVLNGISMQSQTITSKGEELTNTIILGIRNIFPGVYQAGVDLVTKISDGMKSKLGTLKVSIGTIVKSALPKSSVDNNYVDTYQKAGKAIAQGLASGIKGNKNYAEDAAETLAKAVVKSANDVFDIKNSSSKEFKAIGEYIVAGLVAGINGDEDEATGAIYTLGTKILEKIEEYFGIQSPSRLMRDEVGRYIVMGIAEGITSDMSAEEAAEKKASNIANAFKSTFERIDLRTTTLDLEEELWKALNPNASESKIHDRQKKLLDQKLKAQAETVRAAEAEYQATIQVMGETSDQATSAYNKLLQEKIEMANLAKELAGDRKSVAQDAQVAYARLMGENREDLMKMGFTEEQIQSWAEEMSGYTPGLVKKEVKDSLNTAVAKGDIQGIMQAYLDPIPEVVVQTVDTGIQNGSAAARSGGVKMAQSMSEGFQEGAENESKSLGDTVKKYLTGEVSSEEIKNNFAGSGAAALDGLITGAKEKGSDAIGWFGDLASNVLDEVKSKWDEHSPSKEFQKIGEYAVEGLIVGFKESTPKLESQLTTIANTALNSFNTGNLIDSANLESKINANSAGVKFVETFSTGVRSSSEKATAATNDVMDGVSKVIESKNQTFNANGQNLSTQMVNGLVKGVNDGKSRAIDSIVSMAVASYEAAKKALEIQSPSKKFIELGKYVGLGFAEGISSETGTVADASNTLVDATLDSTSSAILHANKIIEDQKYAPIIRPVIDLQQVQDTMNTLDNAYSTDLVSTVASGIKRKAAKMPVKYNPKVYRDNYGMNAGKGGPYSFDKIGGTAKNVDARGNITFIQNNNSPKALSSSTIYRNTKNQFSSMAKNLKNAKTIPKKKS